MTRSDIQHVELMEGRNFLLDDNEDQEVNSQNKKFEPALPDEKEDDVHVDKHIKKTNEHVPDIVNPGLCKAAFSQCPFTKLSLVGHFGPGTDPISLVVVVVVVVVVLLLLLLLFLLG